MTFEKHTHSEITEFGPMAVRETTIARHEYCGKCDKLEADNKILIEALEEIYEISRDDDMPSEEAEFWYSDINNIIEPIIKNNKAKVKGEL